MTASRVNGRPLDKRDRSGRARSSGGDGNQLTVDEARMPAEIAITAAASAAPAIAVARAVATKAPGSVLAPASPLGWLISRTRSRILRRLVARAAEQRNDQDPSTNTIRAPVRIVPAREVVSSSAAGPGPARRSRCPTRHCSGRSRGNRLETQRLTGAPGAGVSSTSNYGFAAEWQAVGQAGPPGSGDGVLAATGTSSRSMRR